MCCCLFSFMSSFVSTLTIVRTTQKCGTKKANTKECVIERKWRQQDTRLLNYRDLHKGKHRREESARLWDKDTEKGKEPDGTSVKKKTTKRAKKDTVRWENWESVNMDMVSKPLCSHQACPLCYLFPLTHFKSNFLSHAFLSLTACLEFFFNLAVKAILPFYFFFSQPAW